MVKKAELNISEIAKQKEREEKKKGKFKDTKANGELNSPAAVQAALVIPWEAWAEDDAVEVCHRATTLS